MGRTWQTGDCLQRGRPRMENISITSKSIQGEPGMSEPTPPTHRCDGVNGAEHHGTQNRCTVCGEYRNGWYDSNGMECVFPESQSMNGPCSPCGDGDTAMNYHSHGASVPAPPQDEAGLGDPTM